VVKGLPEAGIYNHNLIGYNKCSFYRNPHEPASRATSPLSRDFIKHPCFHEISPRMLTILLTKSAQFHQLSRVFRALSMLTKEQKMSIKSLETVYQKEEIHEHSAE